LKEIIVRDKKPVIGHNMFFDLLFLVHNLERPLLDDDYFEFKNILHKDLFPIIFDTKLLSMDLKMQTYSLEDLYKHLTIKKSKHYLVDYEENLRKSHNAFWDAYMTGVCYSEMKN
jgi:poly(A)-specific ribonuclease